MVFELIFGDSAVPGSSNVCQVMLDLQNRGDVDRFCKDLRIKAAGGLEVVEDRRRKAIDFERLGREAEKAGRFEDAFRDLTAAVEILGDFTTPGLLVLLAHTLLELNRNEEAVAICFLGVQKFENKPDIATILNTAYAKLGYGIEGSARFTDEDLERTISRFLAIDSQNWDNNLFLLVHFLAHLKKRERETIRLIRKRRDFLRKIGDNQTLLSLFSKDFADFSAQELRFLYFFFIWIEDFWMNKIYGTDFGGDVSKELTSWEWFKVLIGSYFTSAVSDRGLAKIASWEGVKPELVFRAFISELIPLEALYFESTGKKLLKPVDNFGWFCRIGIAPLICGSKFSEDENAVQASIAMILLLRCLFDNEFFKRNVVAMRRQDLNLAMDFLVLLATVNFLEFKFDLVQVDTISQRENLRSVTSYELSDKLQLLFGQIFMSSSGKDVFPEDFLLNYVPFYVFSARRFAFLTSNIAKLTKRGKDELWSIFPLLAFLVNRRFKNQKLAKNLANCPEFCDFFIPALARFVTVDDPQIDKRGLKHALEFLGKLAAFSPRSYCASVLRSETADHLLEHTFKTELYPEKNSWFCLAALLKNGSTFLSRQRLSRKFPQLMENLRSFVSDRYFNYLKEMDERNFDHSEFANIQLSFLAILPDLLTCSEDKFDFGKLVKNSSSLIGYFASLSVSLLDLEKSEVAQLYARYMQIASLISGSILAKLATENQGEVANILSEKKNITVKGLIDMIETMIELETEPESDSE